MRFASSSRCLGIVDRTARVVSDDCSSSASVAGRGDCCFRHSKFDKLTSYTLADHGIQRERPQKRMEQMADNAVQRYPVRLQLINSETSAPARNLQIQAVAANGDNE
jgi:hypothetical protein